MKENLSIFASYVNEFLEYLPYVIFMSLITFWALFSDNIRIAGGTYEDDAGFDGFMSLVFFLFVLEIILSFYAKKDYRGVLDFKDVTSMNDFLYRLQNIGSFFFWLDIIATLSLMFEVSWMLGESGSASFEMSSSGIGDAQKASKTGKFVRVVRMVRLVRLVKLYKYFQITSKKKKAKKPIGDEDFEEEEEEDEDNDNNDPNKIKQSNIGTAMGDILSRRVIVIILVLLIVIPLLLQAEEDLVNQTASLSFSKIAATGNPTVIKNALDYFGSKTDILYFKMNNVTWVNKLDRIKILRNSEVEKFLYNNFENSGWTFSYIFDIKETKVKEALQAIYMTIFIIFLLLGGVVIFSNDVQVLVIAPVEKMVHLVQKISANPLGVEYKMLSSEDMSQGMETAILLQTINKIGSLMRIGFGDAGASVIAKNLAGGGSKLNLISGGDMIHSIFGFCDVRQFTDTTECLQEEVMLFVNRIAHILHGIVVQCSGAANKNIGDAFLLTWKLDDSLDPGEVSAIADQALLAFCKTMCELGKRQDFICNFSVSATARLYKRFPGYKVRIGSGLHVGWAVEGAIGSNSKIDVSYLSPHVNKTEFLESSTKAYGVSLLMSEQFYKLLSPAVNKYVRQVDRVRTSEKEEPFGLYTYDMDLNLDFNDLPVNKMVKNAASILKNKMLIRRSSTNEPMIDVNKSESLVSSQENSINRFPNAGDIELANKKQNNIMNPKNEVPEIVIKPYNVRMWEDDNELIQLRHLVNDSFRALWRDGIAAYIRGDWPKARDIFHETLKRTNGEDGPSKNLIEVIDHHGGIAPQDWQGYRDEGAGH